MAEKAFGVLLGPLVTMVVSKSMTAVLEVTRAFKRRVEVLRHGHIYRITRTRTKA